MVTFSFLLDTNILSEPGRPQPDPIVAERLIQYAHEIATAAPVFQELLFGTYRVPPSRRRQVLERFVIDAVRTRVPILPYDVQAAEWHAAERVRLSQLGLTPPYVDGQIASIAAVNGLILVTKNVRDYQHFRDLQIEDWRR